jgi:ribosome maturation protein Sdo1
MSFNLLLEVEHYEGFEQKDRVTEVVRRAVDHSTAQEALATAIEAALGDVGVSLRFNGEQGECHES